MKPICSRINWLRNFLAGGLVAVLGGALLAGKDGPSVEPLARTKAEGQSEKSRTVQE